MDRTPKPLFTREMLELAYNLFRTWVPRDVRRVLAKVYCEFVPRIPMHVAVDEFGLDPNLVWYLRPFFEFLYYHYFRVSTAGVSNIPGKGSAIIVSNHAGSLPYDGVMINLAVYNEHPKRRPVRFLVHDFPFSIPFLGSFISRAGGVRASPENAQKLLSHDQLILVFPEGIKGIGKPYDERYKLRQFGRGGFIRTAIRARVPIVPTAVIGSEEIHPIVFSSEELAKPLGVPFFPLTPTFPWLGPLGLVPLPTKWKIIFGKPVRLTRYKRTDADDDELVMKLAEDIRRRIQKMINSALAKRKSIWF